MCFKEFTTSPYEMLVLVKDFFQDIKRLLQNQETFEKDCSRVYRRTCLGPGKAGSSPGEMPRLGLCPVNLCQSGGLGLTCMEQLKSRVSVGVARVLLGLFPCVSELCVSVRGEGAGCHLKVGFGLNPTGREARERC